MRTEIPQELLERPSLFYKVGRIVYYGGLVIIALLAGWAAVMGNRPLPHDGETNLLAAFVFSMAGSWLGNALFCAPIAFIIWAVIFLVLERRFERRDLAIWFSIVLVILLSVALVSSFWRGYRLSRVDSQYWQGRWYHLFADNPVRWGGGARHLAYCVSDEFGLQAHCHYFGYELGVFTIGFATDRPAVEIRSFEDKMVIYEVDGWCQDVKTQTAVAFQCSFEQPFK